MDNEQLLKIYRAVAGPVTENNVDKALMIIRRAGRFPDDVDRHEIRTWYRIKERLVKAGLL